MSNRRRFCPPGRKRGYSSKEAEKVSRYLPLQRRYSAIEAAHAVAQYLDPDPKFWIEQAGLAGLLVSIRDGEVIEHKLVERDDQVDFLSCWIGLCEGRSALREFLLRREGGHHVE